MRTHPGEVFAGQTPSKDNPDRVVNQFGQEGPRARFCGLISHSGNTDQGFTPGEFVAANPLCWIQIGRTSIYTM